MPTIEATNQISLGVAMTRVIPTIGATNQISHGAMMTTKTTNPISHGVVMKIEATNQISHGTTTKTIPGVRTRRKKARTMNTKMAEVSRGRVAVMTDALDLTD